MEKITIDVASSIDEYINRDDWRVKANANQGYSLGGMILNVAGKATANYWLKKIYPEHIGQAHINGDYHIHDLDMLSGYCAGWSLRQLLNEGFNGVGGKAEANPPKHLSVALGQMTNFLGSLQNEWAGAQAFSSFDTYLAPFVRMDKLSYKHVYQLIQEFVYNLNVPSRWGCVPVTTEVLTRDGWKDCYTLKDADDVYSIDENGKLCISTVNRIIRKRNTDGKLVAFRNGHYGYEQLVTTNHRVISAKSRTSKADDCEIVIADELYKRPFIKLPVTASVENVKNAISDDEIMLAAAIYCDGSFDYRGDSLHKVSYFKSEKRQNAEWFEGICERLNLKYTKSVKTSDFGQVNHYSFYGIDAGHIENLTGGKSSISRRFWSMDKEQSELFLYTWACHDGDEEKMRLQFDNIAVAKALQHIAINAGKTSFIYRKNKSSYVKIRGVDMVEVKEKEIIDYDGDVWCPSVTHGTVIFRDKDGCVFISGNTQTPFTNLTFDWVCPGDLKDQNPMIGGEYVDFTYGELQKEMDMLNRAFIEVMTCGDRMGRVFTFPIPTYNITPDFPWDSDNAKRLFEMTAKYGLPYFQNFINSELQPNMVRSMCCRLQLDLRELLKRGNGLFGSAEQTGSIGVVTINCARLGYLHKGDKDGLIGRLKELCTWAKESLEIKRKVLQGLMDDGLYPFSKRYLGRLKNHFSTIGVNGVNELIRNFTDGKEDITTAYGHSFAVEILDTVREMMVRFQEETGNMYNLEATPAEGTTYRFAREDKKRYPGVIQAGTPEAPYYTNSSQLPAGYTDDPFLALQMQDDLQRKYTGGTVLHLYMSERISSADTCKALVKTALSNFRLPYITITPTFSICPKHGYLSGEHQYCPLCDEELLNRYRTGKADEKTVDVDIRGLELLV